MKLVVLHSIIHPPAMKTKNFAIQRLTIPLTDCLAAEVGVVGLDAQMLFARLLSRENNHSFRLDWPVLSLKIIPLLSLNTMKHCSSHYDDNTSVF